MKFTDKEICLCKQIAEKHRRRIELGDWFITTKMGDIPFLFQYGTKPDNDDFIPLWTISDCLEFLEEKGWNPYDMSWICEANMRIVYIKPGEDSKEFKFKADTLLEACLKAVLAVLENKS